MPNTSLKSGLSLVVGMMVAVASLTFGSDAYASQTVASQTIAARMASADVYGVGKIRWGARAQPLPSAPSIYKYQIDYTVKGKVKSLLVCSDLPYPIDQSLFFSLKKKVDERCGADYIYVPGTGYNSFLYPAFEDPMTKQSWIRLGSAQKENVGCAPERQLSLRLIADGQKGDLPPSGIPGGGDYLSLDDIIKCVKKSGIDVAAGK